MRLLQRYLNGERKAVSVVQIPTPDEAKAIQQGTRTADQGT
uniref:Uncharacterized protein n=1 Tax=Candidatus Kentrum sp. SD TaxID=2126332 RepID=A0A450YYV6_9GAMM|nr:MAG: hypothetical protein BECKSD772F_GA0070984_13231 [Candidatus Kentron sp. SD]